MALRFLETFHNINTLSTNNIYNAMVQRWDYYYNTTGSTESVVTGRFGLGGVITPNNSSFFSISKSFSMTGTILRGALDMKSGGFPAENAVFAVNNQLLGYSSTTSAYINQSTAVFFGLVQSTAGYFVLKKAAATLASSANAFTPASTWNHLEFEVNFAVSGSFKLWVNNSLEINYTGDMLGSTTGSPTWFSWRGQSPQEHSLISVWDDSGSGGFSGYLGDFKVTCLLPSGAGSLTQGTPSAGANYTCVDEPFRTNVDYVTLTAGQEDKYAYTDITLTGPVISIVPQAAMSRVITGLVKSRMTCKSGANIVESSDSLPLNYNASPYAPSIFSTYEFKVDPATGVEWTQAGINAAEFGVKAV